MAFVSIQENFYLIGLFAVSLILAVYRKRGLVYLVAVALFVGLNDFIGGQILKGLFERTRPCLVLTDVIQHMPCTHSFFLSLQSRQQYIHRRHADQPVF